MRIWFCPLVGVAHVFDVSSVAAAVQAREIKAKPTKSATSGLKDSWATTFGTAIKASDRVTKQNRDEVVCSTGRSARAREAEPGHG